ncbi:hypothetical protein NGB62_13380 [Mammaliicoccus sciuri]|uniref:hypothetical protein n=1 Tax=Mammaliicoccus sciuri TaxID=1296 RepID=UPI002DB77B0C|nr:hypothetical protein [Mammaliicoccus sciuri]MEB7466152.1 hypothetical protein [Mammaliicoccus sciuri]
MTLLSMTIYAIVSSFTPGPNNIMSLYYSKQTGLRGTVRFCIGVALGFFPTICQLLRSKMYLK